MIKGRVVSVFDRSLIMLEPWLADDYECIAVDLEHPFRYSKQGNLIRCGIDARDFNMPADVYACFAFPPCTYFAGLGARWWATRFTKEQVQEGLDLVRVGWECVTQAELGFLENPVGRLPSLWKKRWNLTFHPADYSGYLQSGEDAYTKKTCLWCHGKFRMPKPRPVYAFQKSKMHRLPDGDKRRSLTPRGFAIAVHHANRKQDAP